MKLEVVDDRPERALRKAPVAWGPGGEGAGETPVFVRISPDWNAKAVLMIVAKGRGYVRFLPSSNTGWVSLDRITPRDE